jgi:hypothetical protein
VANDWLILHGGALGDLVLTIQLALRLPGVGDANRLSLVSRTDPGDLSACRPGIDRRSPEVLGLHWLYAEHDCPPPAALRELIRGTRVLSALGDVDSAVHRRLEWLEPAARFSFDPRPRPDLRRHITQQWQSDLESQGLLIPKCVHQQPERRGLGVPEELRARGREIVHWLCVKSAGETSRKSPVRQPDERLELAPTGPGPVLIHPGSGGREKCWPLANFMTVARQIEQRGGALCFLIGPVELEWWPAASLAAIEREFPVLRLPKPGVLSAALAGAGAVIANDSGPAHLAALLGTRTIVIFGPTAPAVWRPLGRDVQVVSGDPAGSPGDWGIDPHEVAALA